MRRLLLQFTIQCCDLKMTTRCSENKERSKAARLEPLERVLEKSLVKFAIRLFISDGLCSSPLFESKHLVMTRHHRQRTTDPIVPEVGSFNGRAWRLITAIPTTSYSGTSKGDHSSS
ncbi:uncharacterized protein CLUP02_15774 [Colletotrichum lupini]|uniref:Uncharacterized protein n=1 Tax=Colletotrichum lupini TaxID=145971 RepID=A0A9Q8T6P2_9PEZI|nr:uncharacterized protein CLUP02_15774 [Colletotrichum lupini]UQC90244.1 hypothetical protein CLUP02_15774 [Colletotrichum lupini]